MALLIDGYNLLHVTGIFGDASGPHSLQRSRTALLNFLASAIDPAEIPHTTVVFDAKEAPLGRPRTMKHQGITVRFAAEHDDADELIEELVQAAANPRRLTVVSSDHRVQRAARRRKATATDSEHWYRHIMQQRRVRQQGGSPEADPRPHAPLSAAEVQAWLAEFGQVMDPPKPAAAPQPPRNGSPKHRRGKNG